MLTITAEKAICLADGTSGRYNGCGPLEGAVSGYGPLGGAGSCSVAILAGSAAGSILEDKWLHTPVSMYLFSVHSTIRSTRSFTLTSVMLVHFLRTCKTHPGNYR